MPFSHYYGLWKNIPHCLTQIQMGLAGRLPSYADSACGPCTAKYIDFFFSMEASRHSESTRQSEAPRLVNHKSCQWSKLRMTTPRAPVIVQPARRRLSLACQLKKDCRLLEFCGVDGEMKLTVLCRNRNAFNPIPGHIQRVQFR